MRIRAGFVCASFLLAGLGPALLGQAPSKPALALPSAAAQRPASAQTSISAPKQTAATPPRVTFHDGLLSIHAENSTLGDVLKEVQSATGASIDSPGVASERVYVNLGPGLPRDILASLLNGSRYDYIMIGSQQQPNSLARVMLTMRQTSREQPASPSAMARPSPPPTPTPKVEENDTPDETLPDREAPAATKPPVPPVPGQPPAPNTTPGATPGAVQQQPGFTPFGQQIAQPPKTPEQLLRDLQQMQQQQQQQLQLQQQLQQQNNFSR
jgi:hypothetical protein